MCKEKLNAYHQLRLKTLETKLLWPLNEAFFHIFSILSLQTTFSGYADVQGTTLNIMYTLCQHHQWHARINARYAGMER